MPASQEPLRVFLLLGLDESGQFFGDAERYFQSFGTVKIDD